MRRHNSFLLRCWDLGSEGEERIEIEHIQSGAKVLARSVVDATEWICAHGNAAAASDDQDSGATRPAGGYRDGGDQMPDT